MTEMEKMLNGQWYDTSDPQLTAQRDYARDMSEKYNRTTESETQLRQDLLKQLLKSIGEQTELHPSIKFDYGCNTSIGDRCFINFNSEIGRAHV